jgi:hypothetical protein
MPKGVNLWAAAPQTSTAVATFAGQSINLSATGFPASATGGRIRVHTSGAIRVDGFIDPGQLPLYAASELAVVPGHVWISPGQRVAFYAASTGLTVETSLTGPITQTLRVTSPCSSLSLDKRPRPAWDVPGNGRGYLPRRDALELRDQPGGGVVQTIRVTEPGSGMLLWSTESRDGYVHVVYHEDLIIDAWVASSDLTALKQGETMDRLIPPSSTTGGARLAVAGQPTMVRALKEVPLRLSTQETAKPIGSIEAGGDVYVMETVLGWSSILPRALNLMPPTDHSFWVPSAEIGLARP